MIQFSGDYPVPVSDSLRQLLINLITPELEKLNIVNLPGAITLNFRDPNYTAERGGYHPVEIRVEIKDREGRISYITDFCYVGQGWCAELAKSLDFDFSGGEFGSLGFPYVPITEADEIYTVWEENFLTYYRMGVFNVTVTLED